MITLLSIDTRTKSFAKFTGILAPIGNQALSHKYTNI